MISEIARGSSLLLNPADRQIAALIAQCRGAARTITITEIAETLWPRDWAGEDRDGARIANEPDLERKRKAISRGIKASVRRLRRAGYKIGSRRNENPGFFMIQTAKELSETVRPLLHQAVDQLKTIEALTGRQMFARELAGQARLF